jgi:DNA-binding PadR family transcriptional regulator
MLSKPAALLLGVIAERPNNPYELTKLMEYISAGNWLTIAPSSIYTTIKTLEGKGYITGKNVKEGNMPEKTVYTITDTGTAQLVLALEMFLGNMEWDYAEFNIAVILICHLPKERALEILREKAGKLADKAGVLHETLTDLSPDVPPAALHAVKHMIYLTNAEIDSTAELIATVEADADWNHFLAEDFKNERKIQ